MARRPTALRCRSPDLRTAEDAAADGLKALSAPRGFSLDGRAEPTGWKPIEGEAVSLRGRLPLPTLLLLRHQPSSLEFLQHAGGLLLWTFECLRDTPHVVSVVHDPDPAEGSFDAHK